MSLSFFMVYQLINLDKELQQIKILNEKVQDQLMKVIHDLKNPILAIQSIVNQDTSTDLVTVYREINEEAEQGLEMLETLKLTFKVHNAMQLNEEPQKVKLEEYLQSMLNTHTKMATNCKDKLTSVLAAGSPELAIFPKNIVKRILNNFLTNSLKHTGKGLVELSAGFEEVGEDKATIERQGEDWQQVGNPDQKARYMWFQVRDTGKGIPRAKIKKVFQKHESDQSGNNWDGTGIGLMICQSLCTQINAYIKYKSVEEKGTIFRLYVSIQDFDNSKCFYSNEFEYIQNSVISDRNLILTTNVHTNEVDFNKNLNAIEDKNMIGNEKINFNSAKGDDNKIILNESTTKVNIRHENNNKRHDARLNNTLVNSNKLNDSKNDQFEINEEDKNNNMNEYKEIKTSKITNAQSVIFFDLDPDQQNPKQIENNEITISSFRPIKVKESETNQRNSELQRFEKEELHHILIAEDSPVLLKTYTRQLNKYNIHFRTFTNGEECRDQVVLHQSQVTRFLIFTDNQMPLMTGTQLAKDLRTRNISCVIILISADELIDKANCVLFDEMQVKPMKNSKFLDQINKQSKY